MASGQVEFRLKKDLVIWLATVGPVGDPHVVPVWFLWDDKSILVYAIPGQKVRDIQGNPNVELHLNSDAEASDVLRVSGTAKVVKSQPPAHKVPAYVAKYRGLIKKYKWTPQSFAEQYHVAIRVTKLRIH
ncbi:MAG: TIGR03667 family PPOX class F420-dependent oxidoreductase [Candidatus Dormiibacterota bacterium]